MGSGANQEPRSMFTSQTPRMQAPPGDYIIEKEINYRSPFRHPRTDHLSFASGQTRFDLGRDLFEGHAPAMANPAPGEYDPKKFLSQRNGAAQLTDKRKLAPPIGCTTKEVGPGSYGSIDTPMLKKTFN